MLILIEGADGSGKTTLCNKLKEKGLEVKLPIDRLSNFPYSRWYSLSESNEIVIVDRSFITELVYRTVDGKERGTMTLSEMLGVLRYCKIVLCETDTCFEDSMKRGEDNITDKEKSNKIKSVYRVIISVLSKFSNVKTFTYNWKHQTVDDVLDFICKEEICDTIKAQKQK